MYIFFVLNRQKALIFVFVSVSEEFDHRMILCISSGREFEVGFCLYSHFSTPLICCGIKFHGSSAYLLVSEFLLSCDKTDWDWKTVKEKRREWVSMQRELDFISGEFLSFQSGHPINQF